MFSDELFFSCHVLMDTYVSIYFNWTIMIQNACNKVITLVVTVSLCGPESIRTMGQLLCMWQTP